MGLNAAAYTVLNLPLRFSILHMEVWSLYEIYTFKWLLCLPGYKERYFTKVVLPRQFERQERIWVRKWRHMSYHICVSFPFASPRNTTTLVQKTSRWHL